MGRLVNIADHDHFADYAEPANVVPVLPKRKEVSYDAYNRCIRLALIALGFCALVALAFVKSTWNY